MAEEKKKPDKKPDEKDKKEKKPEPYDVEKAVKGVVEDATKKKVALASLLANSEMWMLITFILLELGLGTASAYLITSNGSLPVMNVVFPTIVVTVIALLSSIVENQKNYHAQMHKTLKDEVLTPIIGMAKNNIQYFIYALIIFHSILVIVTLFSTYWSWVMVEDNISTAIELDNDGRADELDVFLDELGMNFKQLMSANVKTVMTAIITLTVQGGAFILDKAMGFWIAQKLQAANMAHKLYKLEMAYQDFNPVKEKEKKKEGEKKEKEEEKKKKDAEDKNLKEGQEMFASISAPDLNNYLNILNNAAVAFKSPRGRANTFKATQLKAKLTIDTQRVNECKATLGLYHEPVLELVELINGKDKFISGEFHDISTLDDEKSAKVTRLKEMIEPLITMCQETIKERTK